MGTWPVVASAPDPAGNVGQRQADPHHRHGPPRDPAAPADAAPLDATAPADCRHWAPGGGGSVNAAAKATVAGNGSQRVKGSSLSIGTKVTAPAEGAVVATANGTVKIKGVKKAIKLTSATATIAAGQSATLKLKPKGARKAVKAAFKKIKKAARKGKKVTATITVKIVDAAGNTRTVKRTVKLTK